MTGNNDPFPQFTSSKQFQGVKAFYGSLLTQGASLVDVLFKDNDGNIIDSNLNKITETSVPTTSTTKNDEGLSTGAIVGITIAVAMAVLILGKFLFS